MSTISPNVTDTGQDLVAITTLASGSATAPTRGTLDLRSKRGAKIFCANGLQGSTAPAVGINVLIRPLMNAGAIEQPTPPTFVGGATAATRIAMGSSGNNAGVTLITTATNTGFAAGDIAFLDDTGNAGIGNSEWVRVASVPDSTHLQLDAPTQYAHNSASAHISNHADVYPPIWVDGGTYVEVIFDYAGNATGSTMAIRAKYQTYDNDTIA